MNFIHFHKNNRAEFLQMNTQTWPERIEFIVTKVNLVHFCILIISITAVTACSLL